MAMTSEQYAQMQRDAQRRYNAKHDKITVRTASGTFDKIRELGYVSINDFICKAIKEKLDRELIN